ncbi:MAG: 30S ribosomal protein S20 [Candidatus Omnitrophica bacterium]|nr:30S ribosomal protein S20 [Candidatus Omnitrophota bacterium]MCM8791008.1 30S ribosomal protein S20 [Candidatus Omnitrophota bacterium]
MPVKRSAYKEIRKSKLRHFKNVSTRTEIKTLSKNFEKLIASKKTEEAKKALPHLVSKIDRAASKGVIKPNTAARKISRLMKKLSSLPKA